MGKESRQRAIRANDEKIIELSLQERFCLVQFFARAGQPGQQGVADIPSNRQDQRRYDRMFEDFDLDGAEEIGITRASESPALFQISQLSDVMEEFITTLDVMEYVTKATEGKIQGQWLRQILRASERMLACKEGTYRAPSILASEEKPALSAVNKE